MYAMTLTPPSHTKEEPIEDQILQGGNESEKSNHRVIPAMKTNDQDCLDG